MREQASSRGTRSCRCCCLNRSQRAGSLCRGDVRHPGRGLRPGGSARRGWDSALCQTQRGSHTGGSASPRPRQPVQADGGGRLIGPSPRYLTLLRAHAKTGRNARLPVRWRTFSHARSLCAGEARTTQQLVDKPRKRAQRCLIVGSIIAGADDGETVCAPACNGRGHAMSPSIGNPHGISAASPLSLERALTGIWRDEAAKSAPTRAKAAGRCGDQAALDKPIASAIGRMRVPAVRRCA
jgi:hypothetical protein